MAVSKEEKNLEQNFICPKCRNRQGHAREIVLPKSGLLDLLPSRDNRYIELTCTLCGYTEFYNRAIYRQCLAGEEVKEEKLPIPEKPNGQ